MTVLSITKPVHDRIISKQGYVNITRKNIGRFRERFFADIFTALVDAQWRYMFLAFVCNYLISWTFFASMWYLMAVLHGDIDYYQEWLVAEDKNLFERQRDHTPCVRNLFNFVSAFLYSIETQNAVGYGYRVVTEECAGPFLLILQLLASMLTQALTIGVIIAKLARPKKRAQNILFSKRAVICHRNGSPYLMFRVADTQKSFIVNAHVRARIIRKRVTAEGELVEYHQEELKLQIDNCDNRIVMLWPTIVMHKIDEKSLLYEMSAASLQRSLFEVVVMLEGGVESTGLQTQARSSYLPSEILWGHRFQSIASESDKEVNYEFFDSTYAVEMPSYSAKDADKRAAENHHTVEDGLDMPPRDSCNADSNFVK